MLRIGKLTDYATVLMTCLAGRPGEVLAASELAEHARLEMPTVSKLLKQLACAGLVESRRGIHGGYRLARAPEQISILQIVVALEGPLGMTECSAVQGSCGHEPHCRVQGNWRRISRVIESALASVTLADMLRPEPVPARQPRAALLRAAVV
jgi:FeS assembly SUF system regulator